MCIRDRSMGCLARMICRLYIGGRMASCTAESAGVRYPIRRIMRCAGKGPMPTAMSVASVPKEKSTTTEEQKDPGLRYAAWGLSFLTKNAARVGPVSYTHLHFLQPFDGSLGDPTSRMKQPSLAIRNVQFLAWVLHELESFRLQLCEYFFCCLHVCFPP